MWNIFSFLILLFNCVIVIQGQDTASIVKFNQKDINIRFQLEKRFLVENGNDDIYFTAPKTLPKHIEVNLFYNNRLLPSNYLHGDLIVHYYKKLYGLTWEYSSQNLILNRANLNIRYLYSEKDSCFSIYLFDKSQEGNNLNYPQTIISSNSINIAKKTRLSLIDSFKNIIKYKVETRINAWQKKGKYEKTVEYTDRVKDSSRKLEIQRITQELFDSLALTHLNTRIINNEYDADNECFKLTFNDILPIIVKVPRNEAPVFDDNLNKLELKNYKFSLNDSAFIILHVDITNPVNNQKYIYERSDTPQFSSSNLVFNFEKVDINLPESNESSKSFLKVESSDVDQNIPYVNTEKQNCYALIIGNEDYSSFQNGLNSEINVPYAINDSRIFREYALKVLGIPIENVIYKENCKVIEMNREIEKLRLIIKNSSGNAEIFFYYAGHGFPDENTHNPYLIPVDVSAVDLEYAVKLDDLYSKLTEFKSKRITVFLDACFSGGARNAGLLASRGVKIKPKENILNGNIVVFSATSGDQSAHPYNDKGHGLFTYFLLKKLQETKGDLTYGELSSYLSNTVGLKSVLINNKEQNPQTIISSTVMEDWKSWKFR